MSLPAVISTTSTWSDFLTARHGPFSPGGPLYALLLDKTANKVRAYKSSDQGNTWAEQNSAGAPACGATANYKSVDCFPVGTDILAANVLSSTSFNIVRFQTATDTWGASVAGPTTPTLNAGGANAASIVAGRITVAGVDYIIVCVQGALETIMATTYGRSKLYQYNMSTATWTGPFDIEGSANTPPANTLPGTAASQLVLTGSQGVASRFHIVYRDSTAVTGKHRVWTAGQFVATPGVIIPATDAPAAAWSIGPMGTYAVGASTGVACVYTRSQSTPNTTKVARCDSAVAEVAANWSTQLLANAAASGTNAPPGCLSADPVKLFAWLTDSAQQISYMDDAGSGTWSPPITWKSGDQVYCVASGALKLSDSIGVLYYDTNGAALIAQTVADATLLLGDDITRLRRAQSFIFTTAKTIKAFRVLAILTGTTVTPVFGQVYTDGAGLPSTTKVGLSITPAIRSYVPTGVPMWFEYRYNTPVAIPANTRHWFVLNDVVTAADAANYVTLLASSMDAYTDGSRAVYDGSVWTAEAASAGDFAFTIHTVEDSPNRVDYDRLVVFAPKVSNAAGSTVQMVYDLGDPAGADSIDIIVDVSEAGSAIAGLVEIEIEHGGDKGAWIELSHVTADAGTATGLLHFGPVMQFIRVTTQTTVAASTAGVAMA